MAAAENKTVVRSFVEEVINQGRFERVNIDGPKGGSYNLAFPFG